MVLRDGFKLTFIIASILMLICPTSAQGIAGSCLSDLYVMAFTSGLASAGSDSTYQIHLRYSGITRVFAFYDRPGDDLQSNKGDLWHFSLSGCIMLSTISQVSIVADGTDGWNIGSVVTLVRDSVGRIQVLTRNFDANFWIDTDNGYDRPFVLSLSLSDVGSGNCLMSLYVIAFTSGLPSSASDTGHSIQLESNGVVQTRSLYDRPGDDHLTNKGDLWSFSFQSSFGLSCIRISDIDRVSIVENGNNGWNIETIVTLVSDSSSHLQVLTRDFDVNRWIDGDEDASHRRFDLSFADINECTLNIDGCAHVCTNTFGSYTCSCNTGYRLATNQHSCDDIHECTLNTDGCSHNCVNTMGSYTCSCRSGYRLDTDGRSCQDINECSLDTDGCDHTCTNTDGSFSCSCNSGYRLASNGQTCNDINECTEDSDGCAHTCINNIGSYSCSCRSGYHLTSNGHECVKGIHGCSHTCTNTAGSYTCSCNSGYHLASDGQTCNESVMLVETPSAGVYVEVDAGSTVYYVCVGYDELDPPSIMWKLGETVLTNGSGSLVTVYTKLVMLNNLTFTQSILELCGVQLENNGGYSCSAIGSMNSSYSFDLKVRVTDDTIGTTVEMLAMDAEQSATNVTQQTTETLTEIDGGLTSVADFVSGPNTSIITYSVVEDVVDTINSLLHWSPASVTTYNNSRFIVSFETIISEYAAQIPTNESRTFNTSSLLVLAENLEIGTLQMSGRNVIFGTNGRHIEQMSTSDGLSLLQGANVSLPPSLFQMINSSTNVGVFYGIYNSSTLFPVAALQGNDTSADRQPQVVSNVVAVTVGQNDMTFENLSQPVTIVLGLQKEQGMYTQQDSERCVSWDIGLQVWTETGCVTTITEGGQVAICQCNHLTNFAVLANVCSSAEACSVVLDGLNNLNDTFNNLTVDNYEAAVEMLSQVIQMSENSSVDQNPSVLNTTEDYFNDLATFLSTSNVTIAENVPSSVIQVVSSLLQWQPENIIVESSSRIVKSFELVLSLYAQQVPVNTSRTFNESSVVFVAERRSVQNLVYNGRSSIIAGTEPNTDIADRVMPGSLSSEEVASVILPNSLFERIMNTADNIGLTFGFYNETVLFPVGEVSAKSKSIEGRQTRVGSLIASAIVGVNKNFQDLQDPVLNTFQIQIPPEMYLAEGSEVCVYWDFAGRDWSPDGCTITEGSARQGIVTCQCNHLTNFAVLVDICLRQDDCSPSTVDKALTFISYIGISISIVCLILTTITLAIFKNIREKDISKFHIQLSLAILLMLTVALVFVAFNVEGIVYEGCVTVSVLLHYFTLVAVMWMGAEALLMFQKLVIVFVTITTKYIVTISVICWSVPIIPVLIPMIVDAVNGNQSDNDIVIKRGEDIAFCFLSHVAAFWASFLGPLLLVMVFNIVIFICVLVVLIRNLRSRATLKKDTGGKDKAVDGKSMVRLMIGIGFVMFLFGLTWLFAILTFRSPHGVREAFLILFTVLNSLQGFFIFIFICVISSDARDEWKKVFKWHTRTSWMKGTKSSEKNSTGTSSTLDSKNIKCNMYALDTLPKDKQAMA